MHPTMESVVLAHCRRLYIGPFSPGDAIVLEVAAKLTAYGVPVKVMADLEDCADDDVFDGLVGAASRHASRRADEEASA